MNSLLITYVVNVNKHYTILSSPTVYVICLATGQKVRQGQAKKLAIEKAEAEAKFYKFHYHDAQKRKRLFEEKTGQTIQEAIEVWDGDSSSASAATKPTDTPLKLQ